MVKLLNRAAIMFAILLGACTTQPAYRRPAVAMPGAWDNAVDGSSRSFSTGGAAWWTELGDPAVDRLVTAGLADNPTLVEAAARIDQARALLAVRDSSRTPTIGIEGEISQSRNRLDPTGGSMNQAAATIGTRLSWEIDLWGRVRENANAARHRLAARTADAQGAHLSIVGEIADTTLALRACNLTLDIRERDIASRETELDISRARLALGHIAPVAVATAQSNLASARTDRITQAETCRRLVDALVALSGLEATAVRNMMLPAPPPSEPPLYSAALPAVVLLGNPGVIAAEREVAARWSEIAVARAARLPRFDLAALLTGQWIHALGSDNSFLSRSAGATFGAPLADGGAGGGNVRIAQAAYREAVAQLSAVVRTTVRDIEDALAAQESAIRRIGTSRDALTAARFTLSANEARWRAGTIAQFELEEARRQLNRAQENAINAETDRGRAWIALMRRTGPDMDQPPKRANGNEPG